MFDRAHNPESYTARLLGLELEEIKRVVFPLTNGQPLPEVRVQVVTLKPNFWELRPEDATAYDVPTYPVMFRWNGEFYDLGDGPIYIYLQQEG